MNPTHFNSLSLAAPPSLPQRLSLSTPSRHCRKTAATTGYADTAPVTTVAIAQKVSLSHFEFCKISF